MLNGLKVHWSLLTANQKQIHLSHTIVASAICTTYCNLPKQHEKHKTFERLENAWQIRHSDHLSLHPCASCQSGSGVESSSRVGAIAVEYCPAAPRHLPPFSGHYTLVPGQVFMVMKSQDRNISHAWVV